jgi:light-regulated signal transduction histidine kinase (bacteriophytochrome)
MSQKILLVDDREDNLLSMESILGPSGYEFVKARSGSEALKILLKEIEFALILMDVKMPNLNGFETAALIYDREKLKHIPIIFITANNYGEENIFKGYRTGAVDYIYKPINPELLRAKVGVFIDLYKKNHRLIAQEQKLIAINKSLENEIRDRIASENQVKELNRRLVENIDRLESANKELDAFAFMASHDLQEPLRKINTFTDILAYKFGVGIDAESAKYLKSIQNAASRMQLLIKDLLTFSKITSEKESPVECDLNQIISDSLKDLESKIEEKNAKIEVDAIPSIPGNPTLLRSLFLNLIENAIKYSRKDIPPIISIKYIKKQERGHSNNGQSGKFCRITVTDNGIGFEQKYAEHIFSMFRRLHTLSEFEGTGIGLAICKKIVEKHNGYISAYSDVNKGSTFIISLPMKNKDLVDSQITNP